MKWLLISNGYDLPQHDTSFYYYNFIHPLIEFLGYPYRIKYDRVFNIVNNKNTFSLESKVTESEIIEIINQNNIQFIIETYSHQPSQTIQNALSRINHPIQYIQIHLQEDKYIINRIHFSDSVHKDSIAIPMGLNLENYKQYHLPKAYDITYIGTAKPEIADFLTSLRKNRFRLNILGMGWEEYKDLRDISKGYLPHWEKQKVIQQSKINLNFDIIDKHLTPRTLEIAISKSFQLHINFQKENLKSENYILKKGIVSINSNDIHQINQTLEEALSNINQVENKEGIEKAYQIARQSSITTHFDTIYTFITPKGYSFPKKHSLSNNQKDPLVSIICHTYNQGVYLEQMILSVLGQSYKDIELYVLDDGSTDHTKDIVSKYSADSRIRYEYQKNIGNKLDAFDKLAEKCIYESRGEYIIHIGGDDIMYPSRIQKQIDSFKKNPNLSILYTDITAIKDQGKVFDARLPKKFKKEIPMKIMPRVMLSHTFINQPSTMIKKSLVREVGGFQFPFNADQYFWNICSHFYKFSYQNIPSIIYRYHDKGSSTGLQKDPHNKHPSILNIIQMYRYLGHAFNITNYFPEIDQARDKNSFLYHAYIDSSKKNAIHMLIPELIYLNSIKALEHNYYGLEAWNHLLVVYHFSKMDENFNLIKKFINEKHHIFSKQPRFEEFNNFFKKLIDSTEREDVDYERYNTMMDVDKNTEFFQLTHTEEILC